MTDNGSVQQDEKTVVYVDAEIKDLIPGFLERSRKNVESISEALDQGDYETICTLGHKMKGNGGGYGFDALTDMGGSIERAAKERNDRQVQHLADDVAAYLQHVEVVYQ